MWHLNSFVSFSFYTSKEYKKDIENKNNIIWIKAIAIGWHKIRILMTVPYKGLYWYRIQISCNHKITQAKYFIPISYTIRSRYKILLNNLKILFKSKCSFKNPNALPKLVILNLFYFEIVIILESSRFLDCSLKVHIWWR